MLERFYTDLAGNVGLGAWVCNNRLFSGIPGIAPGLRRLSSRKIPDEIIRKTRSLCTPFLRRALREVLCAGNTAHGFESHLRFNADMARGMISAGFGNATHVFSMLGEAAPFLVEARRGGLQVINEVYILLSTERIVAEERRAFADWGEGDSSEVEAIRSTTDRDGTLATITDAAICPSEAVRRDLYDSHGFFGRSAVVPYGCDARWLGLQQSPIPKRVLFVGTAELRKGIHYLAKAASMLKRNDNSYEFRVAGNVTDRISTLPQTRDLKFLGRVPRTQIAEEFAAADVFVLPSLAEGSAEVTYEALAAGVPLVVTRACGSVARDGVEGRIVPERDAVALADAIDGVVHNRDLRDKLAAAARERAREFTWENYGERLIEALMELEKANG